MVKILVVFHSIYGHIWKLSEAAAKGARTVDGIEAVVKQVPETLPAEVIAKMGATDAKKAFEHIPIADPKELAEYDGILFGIPVRFGGASSQMRAFTDATGGLWMAGSLVGKVGSVFSSAANQHGGVESSILSFIPFLFHHGMIVSGLPYAFQGQMGVDEIRGGSPYGASMAVGPTGERQPSESELAGAEFQGKLVAEYAKKLACKCDCPCGTK